LIILKKDFHFDFGKSFEFKHVDIQDSFESPKFPEFSLATVHNHKGSYVFMARKVQNEEELKWNLILNGIFLHTFCKNGDIIIAVDPTKATNELIYSTNHARSWSKYIFNKKRYLNVFDIVKRESNDNDECELYIFSNDSNDKNSKQVTLIKLDEGKIQVGEERSKENLIAKTENYINYVHDKLVSSMKDEKLKIFALVFSTLFTLVMSIFLVYKIVCCIKGKKVVNSSLRDSYDNISRRVLVIKESIKRNNSDDDIQVLVDSAEDVAELV
jgi:hypothetical protein